MKLRLRRQALPVPTESMEHLRFADWLRFAKRADGTPFRYFHPANGGWRHKAEAARFQRMGVSPGVPDFIVPCRVPKYPTAPGVVIEMKRTKGGRLSEEQELWLAYFRAEGWLTLVAHGADEAIRFMLDHGFTGPRPGYWK